MGVTMVGLVGCTWVGLWFNTFWILVGYSLGLLDSGLGCITVFGCWLGVTLGRWWLFGWGIGWFSGLFSLVMNFRIELFIKI